MRGRQDEDAGAARSTHCCGGSRVQGSYCLRSLLRPAGGAASRGVCGTRESLRPGTGSGPRGAGAQPARAPDHQASSPPSLGGTSRRHPRVCALPSLPGLPSAWLCRQWGLKFPLLRGPQPPCSCPGPRVLSPSRTAICGKVSPTTPRPSWCREGWGPPVFWTQALRWAFGPGWRAVCSSPPTSPLHEMKSGR